MTETFGDLIQQRLTVIGWSRGKLARTVGVDASYIQRIVAGDRDPPRSYIVEAIARALKLAPVDRDRLMLAAGYAPLSLVQMGAWGTAMLAVADVLNDARLSTEDRAEFEQVISSIAQRWRSTRVAPAATNGYHRG